MASKEYLLQVAVISHLKTAFPQVKAFHCPNQTRSATEAYFNKILGVEPGVSDLIIGWPVRNVGVLELKAEDGRISTAQNKFLSWADSIGWSTGVARSVREVHVTLKVWGLTPAHNYIKEPDYTTPEEKQKMIFDMYKPHSGEVEKDLPPVAGVKSLIDRT